MLTFLVDSQYAEKENSSSPHFSEVLPFAEQYSINRWDEIV